MICPPCTEAARLLSVGWPDTTLIIVHHEMCTAPKTCPCQHKVSRDVVNRNPENAKGAK